MPRLRLVPKAEATADIVKRAYHMLFGERDPVTEPGTAYEQMPTGTGAATWYCHDPATDLGASDPRFTVN
jgi:hypothetical protein